MTTIQVTNIRPVNLHQQKPEYTDYNTVAEYDISENFADSFIKNFTPLNGTKPIELFVDGKNEPLTEIQQWLTDALTDDSANTLVDEKLTLLFNEISKNKTPQLEYWKYHLGYSYLIEHNFPVPSFQSFYTFNVDVQNQAKQFVTTLDPQDKIELICGLIGSIHQKNNVDGILYVLSEESEYEDLKNKISSEVANLNDPQLIQQAADIQSIKFDNDVFTSWVVGSDTSSTSINRIILDQLYHLDPNKLSEMIPMSFVNQTIPAIIAFINIESLANASGAQFDDELNQLTQAQNKLVNLKITKLKSIKQATQITSNTQQRRYSRKHQNNQDLANRAKIRKFKTKKLSRKNQARKVKKVVDSFLSNVVTDNTYKTKKRTFMKPNRRNPDDLSLKGRKIKKAYRPNIHIYLDTSGSVSEEQYEMALKMIIAIVKKVNVDLYFTSFSHVIAEPVLLKTKNASHKQIYEQISRIPKVSGGTEFEQVWQLIDQLAIQNRYLGKAKTINFVITDFDYMIRNSFKPIKNNDSMTLTYYLPLAKDQAQYDRVVEYANQFADALIDKNIFNIRTKIIL